MSFDTGISSAPAGNNDGEEGIDDTVGISSFLKPEKKRLYWKGLTCTCHWVYWRAFILTAW